MQHDQEDKDFIALLSGELQESIEQQINLAAERGNEQISWSEFSGDFN
ncbi:Uncharacterised protein [Cedecea lapagei]|uniref:Uncharacterized protein n=1 Tax=Cedecea lapagei TaxID=158823 RepID=A0A3S4IHW0_9ENTR|nr:hypothetical protein [Cedecea lapagei]VEB97378.1 Uncharacterised protein [Cedecea lapagei]